MLKQDIIDLLIENQPTVLMIAKRVQQRQIGEYTNLFDEDVRAQFLDLVLGELVNELYNKGLTVSLMYDTIGTDELGLFIEEVLKNEQDQ